MPPTNRADLSQFLIHLTKDGSHEFFDPRLGPPPGYEVVYRPVIARDSFVDILYDLRIEARSPFGYFKLKVNKYRSYNQTVYDNGGADPNWIMSVCFSEAPLKELRHFYQAATNKRNQYRKYGLGFWQERIRQKGGNPIFYVDDDRADLLTALDTFLGPNVAQFMPMMHLIDTFGRGVVRGAVQHADFRWEREWRKKDDLFFDAADVAFGICPENEIPAFTALVNNTFPFLDPDWAPLKLRGYLLRHARHLLPHF